MKVTYMLLGDRYVRLLNDDKKVQQLLNKLKDINVGEKFNTSVITNTPCSFTLIKKNKNEILITQ